MAGSERVPHTTAMIRRTPNHAGRTHRFARRSDETLSQEWRVWAAENLLAGATQDEVISALISRGVEVEEAATRVASITSSPAFIAGRRFVAQARRLELVARLHRDHARTATAADGVERVAGLDADAFFTRYYATSTPVVITDVVTRWRAYERWTPAYFKERFGDVEVLAAFGREADPDYDVNTPKHSRAVRLGDFIDQVVAAGDSNDLYLVANNRNMDRPALAALYDDVEVDAAVLDPKRYRGSVALWIGPGGTVTSTHHDTANILFAQVYGQKRFKLVAPWETALFHTTRGVYNTFDPERPGEHHALVKTVSLEPGEMLFIPAGWWHQVRALSLSINIAFTNFTRNNSFDWFRPGEVGRAMR